MAVCLSVCLPVCLSIYLYLSFLSFCLFIYNLRCSWLLVSRVTDHQSLYDQPLLPDPGTDPGMVPPIYLHLARGPFREIQSWMSFVVTTFGKDSFLAPVLVVIERRSACARLQDIMSSVFVSASSYTHTHTHTHTHVGHDDGLFPSVKNNEGSRWMLRHIRMSLGLCNYTFECSTLTYLQPLAH